MDGITPAGIGQFAIERGYWPQESVRFNHYELIGEGAVSASLLRDLPPVVSEYPALPFHAVAVPLDVEIYKEFIWDNGRFSGQMRRGDITVIPAGSPSSMVYNGHYREALNIFISPLFLSNLLREQFDDLSATALIRGGIFRNTWLTELAERIRNEIVDGRPGGRLVVQSLAVAFVVTLTRMMSGDPGMQVESRKSDRMAHPHVKRAIEYIHGHLNEDISLPSLAVAAGCNVERLKHSFKDHVGEPPYRYVLRMRVEKARSLLGSDTHAVSEIAHMCGFNDQAHFTTAFARMVGVTPAKWRHNLRST